MPWLTPSGPIPTDYVCRRIRIPDLLGLVAAVSGALTPLTQAFNWEEFGTLTPDECAALFEEIVYETLQSDDWCMIGTIIPYATTNPPPHTLVCDGAIYLKSDFPLLADVIDIAFDYSFLEFKVPDLVGRFPLGATLAPGDPYPIGAAGGVTEVTLTTDQMPSHIHVDAGHAHGESAAAPNVTTIGPGAPEPTAIPAASITGAASADILPTGGDQPHTNMPPYQAIKYAIICE